MPHHFSKNTVEASVWCDKCRKETMHSIWDGRRGACLVCAKKQQQQPVLPGFPERPPEPEQLELL